MPHSDHAWDAEYRRKGIPSSSRSEPSGALRWLLHNWSYATDALEPRTALDVGCGTGRNTRWLAGRGIDTLGIDWSAEALTAAQGSGGSARFARHDIRSGLPAGNAAVELVVDTFVYFHQVDHADRAAYRQELHRVLRPGGLLLITLATDEDGYYRTCPRVGSSGGPAVVLDPQAEVPNLLFSAEEFLAEMSEAFSLQMTWHKRERGSMHGAEYDRVTLATVWRAR